jgi:mono/diheme cytochrome c family protein
MAAGAALLLLALVGCQNAAPHESPQRVYELHCLGCHGAHGEGPWGPNIQGLKLTEEQIVAIIANGQGKMPAFKGHLSETQMRQLAAYVKTFQYRP